MFITGHPEWRLSAATVNGPATLVAALALGVLGARTFRQEHTHYGGQASTLQHIPWCARNPQKQTHIGGVHNISMLLSNSTAVQKWRAYFANVTVHADEYAGDFSEVCSAIQHVPIDVIMRAAGTNNAGQWFDFSHVVGASLMRKSANKSLIHYHELLTSALGDVSLGVQGESMYTRMRLFHGAVWENCVSLDTRSSDTLWSASGDIVCSLYQYGGCHTFGHCVIYALHFQQHDYQSCKVNVPRMSRSILQEALAVCLHRYNLGGSGVDASACADGVFHSSFSSMSINLTDWGSVEEASSTCDLTTTAAYPCYYRFWKHFGIPALFRLTGKFDCSFAPSSFHQRACIYAISSLLFTAYDMAAADDTRYKCLTNAHPYSLPPAFPKPSSQPTISSWCRTLDAATFGLFLACVEGCARSLTTSFLLPGEAERLSNQTLHITALFCAEMLPTSGHAHDICTKTLAHPRIGFSQTESLLNETTPVPLAIEYI